MKNTLKTKNIQDICNNLICIDEMKYLTKSERWTLYDALKACEGTFGEDVKGEILKLFNNEFNEKYRIISESRIIKKNMDVFNFDEEITLKLYEAIDKEIAVNLLLKEEITLNRILPSRIYLEEDYNRWYLEHIRGGEPFSIWLKKVIGVELLPDINRLKPKDESYRENKKEIHRVKIRVFNEKNSRERALGFLSFKNIISEEISFGYSDITANIFNMGVFKKWVMEMTPQVLVLEPQELKLEFSEIAGSWERNYVAGI